MIASADLQLSAEQLAILEYTRGPLRIIAGAGSGKTEIMTRIVAHLVETGLARPDEILALTFTDRAAGSLHGRIRGRLQNRGIDRHDSVTTSTFHAFCSGLLHEYALQAGIERDFRLLPKAQVWQMMFACLDSFTFEHVRLGYNVGGFIDSVVNLDSALKDELVSSDRLSTYLRDRLEDGAGGDDKAEQTMNEQLEMLPVLHRYAEEKRKANALDYGDLIALVIRLLQENEEVRRQVQTRYRYVLVDEYQDTNIAQKELVKLLAAPDDNLVVVGDPNQAIYTWRGATIYNIVHFDTDFPHAATRTLMTNYRCDRNILRLAAEIARPLAASYDWDAEQVSREDAPDGAVEAFVASCGPAEATEIARRIEEIHGAGESTRYSDMAILYRSWKSLDALVTALRERDIPFEVIGGGEFYKRPEIADIIAYLRLLAYPDDNISSYRLLMGPCWKIGPRDLACLAHWRAVMARRIPYEKRQGNELAVTDALFALHEVEGLSDEARARLKRFADELRGFMRLSEEVTLSTLVRVILSEGGVFTELDASPFPSGAEARAYLGRFTEIAHEFEGSEEGRGSKLRSFVDYLDVVFEAEEGADDLPRASADCVQVMTMHKVKGLQFDTVFVPGLADGEFPSTRLHNPRHDRVTVPYPLRGDAANLPNYADQPDIFVQGLRDADAAEERRLCYVAFTRAKARLVLSRAHFYRENKKPLAPSLFWDEAIETNIPFLYREDEQPPENPYAEWEITVPFAEPGPFPLDLLKSPQTVADFARTHLPPDNFANFQARGVDLSAAVNRLTAIDETLHIEARPTIPNVQTVSALMTYEICPRLYYYTHVLPLPRQRDAAAAAGTDIHRAIEDTLLGRETVIKPSSEEPVDTHPNEYTGVPPPMENSMAIFRNSRFNTRPRAVEQEFTLAFEQGYVRGRIDAVYALPDGGWEIVDFKSGRPHPTDEVRSWMQLPVYALAAHEIWSKNARDLTCTYFFLQAGTEITNSVTDATLQGVRARVEGLIRSIETDNFSAPLGCRCRVCRWIDG